MGESARQIVALLAERTPQDLAADSTTRAAVLWYFTVLGEAARKLPLEFTSRYPDVPWQQASRLRNRIVHGYWSISATIVHDVATDDLPAMIEALDAVLKDLLGST